MFPPEFIHRVQSQFADADRFINALSLPVTTAIRKHPVKGKEVDLDTAENIPWCKEGFYLKERPVFTLDPHFHAGAYYVQESSSMFIHTVLDQLFAEKDIRILDLCAAPGGKSTLIASWLNGEGVLVSNEVIRSRANILLENMIKWGYPNTWVTSTDVHILGGLREFFNAVLIDAPCSGEGLFRKDKNAINEWSESNCDLCAKRQRKILADILPSLAIGGYCIYSTCTFNPAENDDNLEWMLKEFPLELVSIEVSAFAQISETNKGGYAFYPHQSKGEGFYCAILRKTGEINSDHHVRRSKIKWDRANLKMIDIEGMVKTSQDFEWFQHQENIFGVHTNLMHEWNELSSITKVLGGVLSLGAVKGKDLVPHHALAMSLLYSHAYPTLQVDKETALLYLAKKELNAASDQMGWHAIQYGTSVLGFAKYLGNRINNYYPMEWRIRMDL
jgi:16S rRNA C967 or C1407 C5-methylase (RsmB/RsmF family)/NOL1/NOP2/fmu family ribosome biogenesis protein